MVDDEQSLTKIHIQLPNHWAIDGESLWALPLGDDLYEIRNTPFHAYAINWGDIVRAPVDSDQIPQVQEVVKRSGHETFRVLFNSELGQTHRIPFWHLCRRLSFRGRVVMIALQR